MGYHVVKKAWQYIQPFWYSTSVWQTDRRTDGQTDVQPISITCFSIADARENWNSVQLRNQNVVENWVVSCTYSGCSYTLHIQNCWKQTPKLYRPKMCIVAYISSLDDCSIWKGHTTAYFIHSLMVRWMTYCLRRNWAVTQCRTILPYVYMYTFTVKLMF